MTNKLTLTEVTKHFGTNRVLDQLSISIAPGEVVSFIGASGSGKTTLLRCINLLETIDDGSIHLDDLEITRVGVDANPIRRRVGIVFQSFNLFPHMSVMRNTTLALTEVLALNPEVLLLDEITSALDPELVGEVLDVVRELKGSGITLLLATHEMGFAREISDRVCFLANGTIAESGHPDQIFGEPKDQRTQQFLARVINSGRLG